MESYDIVHFAENKLDEYIYDRPEIDRSIYFGKKRNVFARKSEGVGMLVKNKFVTDVSIHS